MGLFYPQQYTIPLIGTKSAAFSITGVALTSSYQSETGSTPTKSFRTGDMSRIEFLISYTEGAAETANSIQWKVEASNDGTNWFQLANDSTSGGTSTLTAREFSFTGADGATAKLNAGLDIAYEWMRISVKETGVASNVGNVFVEALLSGC